MKKSIPFKVTLSLATPFYLGQMLTLDALLSAAIYKKLGKYGRESIEHIPLEQVNGVFKGSSLFCHPRYKHQSIGRVMALRGSKDLNIDLFPPNGRGGKNYIYVDQQRGQYKATMNMYAGIYSHEVYFWGVGDPDAVEELLSTYILGIGKRANAGAGEIMSVQCETVEDDFSWITSRGLPARPLPIDIWNTLSDLDVPTMPMAIIVPYYDTEEVLAVFPTAVLV